jgi:radical SAM protein with 4Fe4S-binding SPASM domain
LQNWEGFFTAKEIREREEDLRSLHDMGFDLEVYAGIPVSWSRKEKYLKVENKNPLIACTASTVLAAVLANQRLSPCILFSGSDYSEPMPDPKNLKLIWRDSPYFNRIRKIRLQEIPLCRTCGHYGKVCKTECRAKAYLFHGNIATPDPDCDYYRSLGQAINNSALKKLGQG